MNRPAHLRFWHADVIELRRALVARLRARSLTIDEIYVALQEDYDLVNPDTGRPYCTGTIAEDLSRLNNEWRRQATEGLADHKGRVFQELQAVKRQAWLDGNLTAVLSALVQERQLLGLDAIQTHNVTFGPNQDLVTRLEAMADRLVQARASSLSEGVDATEALGGENPNENPNENPTNSMEWRLPGSGSGPDPVPPSGSELDDPDLDDPGLSGLPPDDTAITPNQVRPLTGYRADSQQQQQLTPPPGLVDPRQGLPHRNTPLGPDGFPMFSRQFPDQKTRRRDKNKRRYADP